MLFDVIRPCVLGVFRSSKSLRPSDIGGGQQSSPFLVLRAENTISSILKVSALLVGASSQSCWEGQAPYFESGVRAEA